MTPEEYEQILKILRKGTSISKVRHFDHEDGCEWIGCDEHLRRQLGSDKAGVIRTGLRTLSNVDRTKKQKQSWSEEDVRNIQDIDSVLFYTKNLPEDTCMRLRNWLKSLSPQNAWRPSGEQIKALEAMLTVSPQSPAITSALIELYKQLKKLREE